MGFYTVKFGPAVNNAGKLITSQGHGFIGLHMYHAIVFQIDHIFDVFLLAGGQQLETAEIFFIVIRNSDRTP